MCARKIILKNAYSNDIVFSLGSMNINLKRKGSTYKSTLKKPRKNGFGFNNGQNGSSESESEEMSFEKSIQAKSQRIAKQLSEDNKTDIVDIISELEEPDSKNQPKQKVEGLKYINKLLESKKQRAKDRILSRQEYTNKQIEENKDAIVFESEDYKKQKEEVLKMKEEDLVEDKEPNNAQFYSNLLQVRDRRNDVSDIPQSIIPSQGGNRREANEVFENNKTNESKGITRKTGFSMNILNYKSNEKDEKNQLIENLKNLIRSKVTPDDIREYKKRYWNRHDN